MPGGLKGQARLPQQRDPRVRRNAAGLASDAEAMFSGALDLVNGIITLTLGSTPALDQSNGLVVLVKASPGGILKDSLGLYVDNTVYVPYTGATTNLDLGVYYVAATQVRTPEIKTDASAPTDLTLTTGAAKTAVLGTVVYDDLVLPMIVRIIGPNRPTLATMVGNILQYQFAVDDEAEIEATEILHGWKEDTPLELHVHWVTGGLNDATPRGVRWEIEYSWANPLHQGGTTVFGTTTVISGESTVAANEPALTHHYTNVTTFTPTGGKVGAFLVLRLRRIASTTVPTAPAANPFGLALGVHYQKDTIGSRSERTK